MKLKDMRCGELSFTRCPGIETWCPAALWSYARYHRTIPDGYGGLNFLPPWTAFGTINQRDNQEIEL